CGERESPCGPSAIRRTRSISRAAPCRRRARWTISPATISSCTQPDMAVPTPTLRQRLHYGARVMALAFGVVSARVRDAAVHRRMPAAVPYNTMFRRSQLPQLESHPRTRATFDLYLFDIMNSERLRGEKVFEYGTLLNGVSDWKGLR